MKPEFFCAEDERDWLRQQLAASQAREQQLREAFEQVMDDIRSESYLFAGANGISVETEALAKKALAQPSDTTALEALIAKAGEVMRERAAVAAEELRHPDGYSGETVDWCQGTQNSADAIRALPAVTLDDLKGGEA